jgi:hypothetical protein
MRTCTGQHAFLVASAIILCTSGTTFAADAAALLRIKPGPQLLVDDYLVESQSQVKRQVESPARLPEPIITGGTPEGGGNAPGRKADDNFQPYISVVRDPQTKKFRVWYDVPANRPETSPSRLATMESDDGVEWKRPHRVLDDPGGMAVRFGASIIDDGPNSRDPTKRYKFGWNYGEITTPPKGGLMIATSADGLRWTPITDKPPVITHTHDINSIHRDPIRGNYIAILSQLVREPSHYRHRRITTQAISDDLVNWSSAWPILIADEHDEPNTEFYAMSGIIARGDLLVGLVKVLRDDLPADPGGPTGGIGYTALAWSRDGHSWTRDREPFLPRNSQPGSWDHAMTWGDCQLPVDDEIFIYYGGYKSGHKIERFVERQVGLARMKRDRYIARIADGSKTATLQTKPLVLSSAGPAKLTVNAALAAGEMRVRLLSEKGAPIRGFDFDDCTPIRGDAVAHPVLWSGGAPPVSGERPFRLEFRWTDGRLYAFDVAS